MASGPQQPQSPSLRSVPTGKPRIVIVGGGHAGLNIALRLQKQLADGEARVTLIDPQSHMTYQPFLPEAAAGSIEPRHVVVPLRETLRRSEVLTAQVTCIDHEQRELTATLADGSEEHVTYDVLVVVPGSISRALPIPGSGSAAWVSRPSARPSTCAITCCPGWTSRPAPRT